jgi:SET domain-containing protein
VALVAVQRVPAGVELTYNYGSRYEFREGADESVPCQCGAPSCIGFLK